MPPPTYRPGRGRPSNVKKAAASKIQAAFRARTQGRATTYKNRSHINKNKIAIKKLNQKALGGQYQRNFQICRFSPALLFSPIHPICFALNDFTSMVTDNTSGGQVFSPVYTPSPPPATTQETGSVIIGNWLTINPAELSVNNLSKKFQQWSDTNDSTVSPVEYMPLSAKYFINFSRQTQDSAQPSVSLRIDIITTRRTYLKSQYHDYTMPECLGAFSNMAISNIDGNRNAYNKGLWSVRSQFAKLPAIDTGINVIRQNQSKCIILKERFPAKNIKLHIDPVSATQREPFHLAVDPDIIRWCVLSIGDTPVTGPNSGVTLKLNRIIKYRDHNVKE